MPPGRRMALDGRSPGPNYLTKFALHSAMLPGVGKRTNEAESPVESIKTSSGNLFPNSSGGYRQVLLSFRSQRITKMEDSQVAS